MTRSGAAHTLYNSLSMPSPETVENSAANLAPRLLEHFSDRLPAMLTRLEAWVNLESPTTSKPSLDGFGRSVAAAFAALGAEVRVHPAADAGDSLELLWTSPDPSPSISQPHAEVSSEKHLLILGHLDTVYPLGTLAKQPFRVAEGRAFGPGVLDMKAGLVSALFALAALAELQLFPRRRLRFLFTADEEMGSRSSRPLIEACARDAAAVLVLEPGSGAEGKLKTARKGIADYRLTARGRAAHAGVDFEAGASAIVELARQVIELAAWSDPARGLTLNPGVIHGGTRTNVVAAEATLELELRAWKLAELEALTRRLAELRPSDPRVTLSLEGRINRPPLERTAAIAALFAQARDCGRQLGLELEESSTGGGSDGNFTAALGVPTLDGLGAAGEGAHSPGEYIRLDLWPQRTALLALLLARL